MDTKIMSSSTPFLPAPAFITPPELYGQHFMGSSRQRKDARRKAHNKKHKL